MNFSREFIKYCLVGVVNTLVGLSTAYILMNPLNQSYELSVICAYIVGIIVSFTLNKKFTFRFEENTNIFILFAKFAFSMLPCYLISYYVLGPFITKVLLKPEFIYNLTQSFFTFFGVVQERVFDNTTVLMSMAVYLVLGFSLNKYFIFRKRK